MKQLGLAFAQYSQDYDERLPLVFKGPWYPDFFPTWRTYIYPYVKNSQVYACPSGKKVVKFDYNEIVPGTTAEGFPVSYAANGFGGSSIGGTATLDRVVGRAISTIPHTTQTLLLFESGCADKPWAYWDQGPSAYVNGQPQNAMIWGGHTGTANYLFVDGHVKSLRFAATASPVNMWTIEDDGPAAAAHITGLKEAQAYWDAQ